MTPTALILGAAGRLGQVLATTFASSGWRVIAQSRKPLPPALTGRAGVTELRCDALDVARLTAAAQGAQVVINTLNPVYTKWDTLALPLADAALQVARASGALLMLPGNVYNFGNELPPLLTPTTPERGNTSRARIRIEMEARLAAANGLDSVVLRAGDFFGGPGRGSWFDLGLASRLDKGRFIYPGALDLPHAWAYLPDLAQAFVRVAERRASLTGHHRLHFAGHTATGDQMRQAFERATGRALRVGGLPWGLMRLCAPVVPSWRAFLEMRYLWERPHALDGAALRALVGDLPATPLDRAVADALVELVAQPAQTALARA